VTLEVLKEETGFQRNRRYRFKPYLDLFADDNATESAETDPGKTRS
jgi:hypothetical protein